ncbi:alpha/beta hydrolase family protein [Pelagicoccus mobilis]|uniref:Alpha/beta fold hydrolase n=1 Tax=Pelagicoccus mobilis TaxID=415221 RepID=A0A934VJH2_9BACT|nr:alpha/beta fold hydrolase [Pelagicoccus mobilis]MBK1875616.1 alpha/beta fold hydrolase [Pelagicoccus mobilis]
MNTATLSNRYGQRIDATFHSAPNDAYLALLGHGITGNKDRPLVVGLAEELANLGIPSLRFSFAGNGKSQGRFEDCTITSQTEDLVDLLGHVSNTSRHIIYIGHSLGGAVGTLVAANEPNRIHTLVSLAGMVHTTAFFQREFGEQTPGDGFMWDEPACPLSQKAWDNAHEIHNTLDAAQRITQPWLLFHGTDDDVVPVSDSRDALAATASPRTDFYERPGEEHMFSKEAYPEIAKAIVNFLR